jgi:hypothetical protein
MSYISKLKKISTQKLVEKWPFGQKSLFFHLILIDALVWALKVYLYILLPFNWDRVRVLKRECHFWQNESLDFLDFIKIIKWKVSAKFNINYETNIFFWLLSQILPFYFLWAIYYN